MKGHANQTLRNPTEISRKTTEAGNDHPLSEEETFLGQPFDSLRTGIEQWATILFDLAFETMPAEAADQCFEFSTDKGVGTYRCFSPDETSAVIRLDVRPSSNIVMRYPANLLCFGSLYADIAPGDFGNRGTARRPLLAHGSIAHSTPYTMDAERWFRTVFIALTPQAVSSLSLTCHCDPLLLAGSIRTLDDARECFRLKALLDELHRFTPSTVTAHAYYTSKIMEAAAILVDMNLGWTDDGVRTEASPDHQALDQICDYIENNLDRSIRTGELCAIGCMGTSKLIDTFKAIKGATPQEYIHERRMDRAHTLVAHTARPFGTIASDLGFTRQSSFSESFKNHFGITPREYRASHRHEDA